MTAVVADEILAGVELNTSEVRRRAGELAELRAERERRKAAKAEAQADVETAAAAARRSRDAVDAALLDGKDADVRRAEGEAEGATRAEERAAGRLSAVDKRLDELEQRIEHTRDALAAAQIEALTPLAEEIGERYLAAASAVVEQLALIAALDAANAEIQSARRRGRRQNASDPLHRPKDVPFRALSRISHLLRDTTLPALDYGSNIHNRFTSRTRARGAALAAEIVALVDDG